MNRDTLALTIPLLCLVCMVASAQEIKQETVIEGLHNPCGVAIQPETGHVFVSDSGNRRIIRIVDGKQEDVIVNFPEDIYGEGPKFAVGPLGLTFINKQTLVVGGGGLADGADLIRVYQIPEAGSPPMEAAKMVSTMSLPADGDTIGEGNFYGLAASTTHLYVTCNGDDTKGWVARAKIDGGKPKDLKRYIATKELTSVDAPVAVTMSPLGEIVIGQMGEIKQPGDSLLTFYDQAKGNKLANFKTGLNDITALAYSPKRARLFALDFSWNDPGKGGLYKLVDDGSIDQCEAREIIKLDRPTAMVFDAEGNAYVTIIGSSEDSGSPSGKLLKISGLDDAPTK